MATTNEPDATTDYIEYAGDPVHGAAFLTSHTITRKDPLWERNGVQMDRDLVWERDPAVPVGQKTHLRLALKDLPAGAAKALETLPEFKRVSA